MSISPAAVGKIWELTVSVNYTTYVDRYLIRVKSGFSISSSSFSLEHYFLIKWTVGLWARFLKGIQILVKPKPTRLNFMPYVHVSICILYIMVKKYVDTLLMWIITNKNWNWIKLNTSIERKITKWVKNAEMSFVKKGSTSWTDWLHK